MAHALGCSLFLEMVAGSHRMSLLCPLDEVFAGRVNASLSSQLPSTDPHSSCTFPLRHGDGVGSQSFTAPMNESWHVTLSQAYMDES